MHTSLKSRISFLAVVVSVLFFNACSLERQYAFSYVDAVKKDSIPVYFMGADYLFKINATYQENPALTETENYIAAIDSAKLLKAVNDSLVIENYNNSFRISLKKMGYKVYEGDQLSDFIAVKKPGFILSITQLEIEEDTFSITDSETFGDLIYYQQFYLTTVNLNSWVEFSSMNDSSKEPDVFYNTNQIVDRVDGFFYEDIRDNSKIKYSYTKYNITPGYVANLATVCGRIHMENIFDYWMNEYIMARLPSHNPEYIDYYHYNSATNKLSVSKDDKAIKL
ncbi:MAG: hypothetical protein RQ866_01825 [Bacteroidales bacterium]|nr:hypothetical protein [Bacteroidales bacterium]